MRSPPDSARAQCAAERKRAREAALDRSGRGSELVKIRRKRATPS